VFLPWDPNGVTYRRILSTDKTTRWLVQTTLCKRWCRCLADQLWLLNAYATTTTTWKMAIKMEMLVVVLRKLCLKWPFVGWKASDTQQMLFQQSAQVSSHHPHTWVNTVTLQANSIVATPSVSGAFNKSVTDTRVTWDQLSKDFTIILSQWPLFRIC